LPSHASSSGRCSAPIKNPRPLLGIIGPDGGFTDVCIGLPGSTSDDQVLDKSALQQRATAGMMAGSWLIGGASHPLTVWLLVPYTHQNVTWLDTARLQREGRRLAASGHGRVPEA
jgi:hypothetical protein